MTLPCLLDVKPEIAARIDRSWSILLGLDFDGTLTPLRARPDEVMLAEPVRARLARLSASRRLTVMIVSGRSLPDLVEKVGLPGLIYAGNHGLEIQGPGLDFVEPTATALVPRLEQVTDDLRTRLAGLSGTLVEAKRLTTSVHYRNVAPGRWNDVALIVQEAVARDPARFVARAGRRVWEIRPRVSWHKGHALNWARQHLEEDANPLIFFLGDDRTDEDAFASLPDGITVKVGAPWMPTRARYRLLSPDSVYAFLEWLERTMILDDRSRSNT
jgi:trehalose 6-phosphate phosphatase